MKKSAVKLQLVTEEHALSLDNCPEDRHEAPRPLQLTATRHSVMSRVSLRGPIQTSGFHAVRYVSAYISGQVYITGYLAEYVRVSCLGFVLQRPVDAFL